MGSHPDLIYWLVSGRCFFLGAGLLLAAVMLPSGKRSSQCRRISCALMAVGVVLVACSATPLPLWVYGIWFVVTAAWLTMRGKENAGRCYSKAEVALRVGVGLTTIVAFGLELPWHLPPLVVLDRSEPVYVIGDSLSVSSAEGQDTAWPQILAQEKNIIVVNLSRPAATAKSAASVTDKLTHKNAVVILEIGGNDLFGPITVTEFGSDLEDLIQQVRGPQRTLVMFELPLFPLWNNYGRVQRRLSRKYEIKLIPKAILAGVLTSGGNTIDGIHLTEKGHRRMAQEVRRMLRWNEHGEL